VKILDSFLENGDDRLHLVVDEIPTAPLEEDIYEDTAENDTPILWHLRKFEGGIYRFSLYRIPWCFGKPDSNSGVFASTEYDLVGGFTSNAVAFNTTGILEHDLVEVVLHEEKREYTAHVGYHMENK
jgi:hypothetical protein